MEDAQSTFLQSKSGHGKRAENIRYLAWRNNPTGKLGSFFLAFSFLGTTSVLAWVGKPTNCPSSPGTLCNTQPKAKPQLRKSLGYLIP
jgi:hypothetical protein